MIEMLTKHIGQTTVDHVVDRIIEQYRSFRQLTSSPEFMRLFSEEYAPHKKQHSVSWAISSGFPSGSRIGELSISRLVYGKGHTRPVLSNEFVELHILNSSTDFNAKYLRDRYSYNADNFSGEKLFCYIRFFVENNKLQKVELCLPNEHGVVVSRELLLSTEELKLVG